jgi:aryl-alcohol dehydrogenase
MGRGVISVEIEAAVIERAAAPFAIQPIVLGDLRAHEVRIKVVASGICQTDAHARDQHIPVPLPAVLGHEGAGIIEKVGSSVTGLVPGDHVVMSYNFCGHCKPCLRGSYSYCELVFPLNFGGSRLDGTQPLFRSGESESASSIHGHFFGQSSFATHAIADARSVVKVRRDVPLELLAPFGCGFQTGFGAVVNSLGVRPGSSIAILGTGAVGLAAVMAAKISGAQMIIAVDVKDERLSLARELGATHSINASAGGLEAAIMRTSGSGVDFSLEITGRPDMAALAVDILAPLGKAGLIGSVPPGTKAPIDILKLMLGRSVRGIHQGDAVSQLLIPQMVDYFAAGVFPIDRLIKFYDFKDINRAFADAAAGSVIKPVLKMSSTPNSTP